MGQPTRATSELALDVGKLMPWVRKRLLSWFARGSLLPLARAGQDAVRGRRRGNPAAEDHHRRSCAGLLGVYRALKARCNRSPSTW